MSMAAANNKTVDEVVTQTSNDRVKTANEAGSLLASEQNLSNEQDAEKQKANGKWFFEERQQTRFSCLFANAGDAKPAR